MSFGGDKAALVTGAGSGIGAATVRRLVGAGVRRFALVDLNAGALEALARDLHIEVLAAVHDVACPEAWASTEQDIRRRFGQLDYAVVNAGVAGGGAIAELDFGEWRRILSVNLDGAFLTLRAAMRLLRDGGAVVVVSSAAGVKAEAGTAAYAASKAGAAQLAKVAAKEAAARGVRVNAILPGGVDTPIWDAVPFFRQLVETEGDRDKALAAMARLATPLGRYADADEIAAQIAFLLSDAAATMTGALLLSDGGYTL